MLGRGEPETQGPVSFDQWTSIADCLTQAFEDAHAGRVGAMESVRYYSSELQRLTRQLTQKSPKPCSH